MTPRLSHANSAVVLSAVKVLMKFMELLPKDLDYYGTLLKKLAPPLVTLLSAEPELQYVALRNINLIVQKRCVAKRLAVCTPSLLDFIMTRFILSPRPAGCRFVAFINDLFKQRAVKPSHTKALGYHWQ